MPPVQTQIKCPQCGQPILAHVEQLLDVAQDPQAKARLLSGQFNLANCPHCGYNGALSTPVVYHDPEKELLLTFFPPELSVSRQEQESTVGALINQVMNNLPQEQRKGYLLSPQSVLTMQGLMERVLEADGITKEMLEAQRQKMNLLQSMLDLDDEALAEVAKQEDENIDAEFFSILGQLLQASAAAGDEQSARKLGDLQNKLLPLTTFGQQIEEQTRDIEAVAKRLQEIGQELSREKLLELALEYAENEAQLRTLVSLTRPGLDYQFFTTLTEKIDGAEGDEQQRLSDLRERLLELTRQIDQELEARLGLAKQNLDALLEVENIPEAIQQNLPAIDDFFIQVLEQELAAAQQNADTRRLEKLQQVVAALQQASGETEVKFLQDLLEAPDDAARATMLEERSEEVTDKFLETLTGLMVQLQDSKDQEMADQVRGIYRQAVKQSMQAGMKG